jgi:hypothetical protein
MSLARVIACQSRALCLSRCRQRLMDSDRFSQSFCVPCSVLQQTCGWDTGWEQAGYT